MRAIKWTLIVLAVIAVGLVLDYSLPNRDVMRITGQEVKRMEVESEDSSGNPLRVSRDISFVYAVDRDGNEISFRNEDTDWSWPPYFKFDTGTIASKVANHQSNAADPVWVIITYYGWRFELFSMFPNIVTIERVDSPDQELFPWFNIIVIATLIIVVLLIRRFILRKYERHVEPLIDGDPDT
jgi:hypothetical protein